jgi:hypothetical protein
MSKPRSSPAAAGTPAARTLAINSHPNRRVPPATTERVHQCNEFVANRANFLQFCAKTVQNRKMLGLCSINCLRLCAAGYPRRGAAPATSQLAWKGWPLTPPRALGRLRALETLEAAVETPEPSSGPLGLVHRLFARAMDQASRTLPTVCRARRSSTRSGQVKRKMTQPLVESTRTSEFWRLRSRTRAPADA